MNRAQLVRPWSRLGPAPLDGASITRSKGHSVTSTDRRELFDASAGLWNVNIGHGNQQIIEALSQRLQELTFRSLIFCSGDDIERLANELLELLQPWGLSAVSFHTTGTAANECALIQARRKRALSGLQNASRFVALKDGFHGSSFLLTHVSGVLEDHFDQDFVSRNVVHVDAPGYGTSVSAALDQLTRAFESHGPDRIAALIVEPVMGCLGGHQLPRDWLLPAIELCHAHGIVVIADEVASGLGRCGDWLAFPRGLEPDIVTVSKGLGCGYAAIAATAYSAQFTRDFFEDAEMPLNFGSTMDGSPGAVAVAREVIRQLRELAIPQRVQDLRTEIQDDLDRLEALPAVMRVAGPGLMIGIHLDPDTVGPNMDDEMIEVCRVLAEADTLLDPEGIGCLLFYPPLTSSAQELRAHLQRIARTIEAKWGPRCQG